MKIITTLLFTVAIPLAALAQPTLTHNEYYHAGDNVTMVNCDTAGLTAGDTGASAMWDYSYLSASGATYSYSVATNSSGLFSTAALMITFSDGTKQFIQENSTDSYLNGYIDGMGDTISYNYLDAARRPFTYGSYYNDSDYQISTTSPYSHGSGGKTFKGDGYGTLKLPTGTFNNVLRIKEVRMEGDSSTTDTTFATYISYLWFDTAHTAPLLRIDYTISALENTTVRYLAANTAVNNVAQQSVAFTAALTANQLFLNSDMQQGKEYTVKVYNIIGQKLYNNDFTAAGGEQRLNTNAQLSDGIYLISLTQKDYSGSTKIIKVVKQ